MHLVHDSGISQMTGALTLSDTLHFPQSSVKGPCASKNLIRPIAAQQLNLGFVNWQCPTNVTRTKAQMAGADIKDRQAQKFSVCTHAH